MNINLNPIKIYEGLVLHPYKDSVGVSTIGYGSTFYEDGRKVSMKDPAISKDRAEQLLRWYVLTYCVPAIKKYVTQPLNDNQTSALASFIYNLGPAAFGSSTLLKKINQNPKDPTITDEFMKWCKAGGHVLDALLKRRKSEAQLYFSPIA